MASVSYILNSLHIRGWKPLILKRRNCCVPESLKYFTGRNSKRNSHVLQCSSCYFGVKASSGISLPLLDASSSWKPYDPDVISTHLKLDLPATSGASLDLIPRLVLADLDPATAKVAIGVLGPFLSVFAFLFILRIVMSWYPRLPVGKFPYIIAYAPTEPLLIPTRKLIPPLGGVDVTPVVWFGLISFLNEILVGPQGLLVLLSQQVN